MEENRDNARDAARRAVGTFSSIRSLLSESEVARFFNLVREDLSAHDGEWSRPGFQALLVYRFGVWRMSVSSKLLRAPLSVLWRVLFSAVRNVYGIELPFTARIGRRVIFEHQHGIVVHGNTEIGDDCIIRQGVTLGIRRMDRLTDAPILGQGVNVGAGAKILGRVSVGDRAEIGANAVVLDDVPAHTLAVGIPAHQVTRNQARVKPRERARVVNGISRSALSNGVSNGLTNGSSSQLAAQGSAPSKGPSSTRNGPSSTRNGPSSTRANGPGSTLAGVRTN